MNILERFLAQAEARAEAVALVEAKGARWSFGGLREASARAAAMLAADGIGPGDRVVVLVPMSGDLYVLLLALFRLGAVPVVFDPGVPGEILRASIERLEPRALLGIDRARWLVWRSPALRRIAIKRYRRWWGGPSRSWRGWRAMAPREELAAVGQEAAALITFTSGSTGRPKIIVRPHGLLLAQHDRLAETIALEPGEVDLTTLPVFVLANLGSGLTSVLAPQGAKPAALERLIRREGVTRTVAALAFLERLLESKGSALRGLRKIYTGGAPVSLGFLERLRAAAPGARIEAVYGSSEAEPIAHATLEEWRSVEGAGRGFLAGRVDAGTTVSVIRDRTGEPLSFPSTEEWEQDQIAPGEMGEIVVAGPHVVAGYLDGVGEAETKFDCGGRRWHRTGDAGSFDTAGRLWLGGRCEGRVRVGERWVYPLEVEPWVLAQAGVARAAWLAVGGRAVLAVELRPEAPEEAVLAGIRAAMAERSLPAEAVRRVARIPLDRRHASKVDYGRLRALLAAH